MSAKTLQYKKELRIHTDSMASKLVVVVTTSFFFLLLASCQNRTTVGIMDSTLMMSRTLLDVYRKY